MSKCKTEKAVPFTVSLYPSEIRKYDELVKKIPYRKRSDLIKEWIKLHYDENREAHNKKE